MSKAVEEKLKEQEEALAKAAPKSETPPKAKHIRSAVITTWQHGSGVIFWSAMLKMPLGTYSVTCYKCLIIIHKLLHDGHPSVLPETFRQKGKLLQLGQIWKANPTQYSAIIDAYVRFLVCKLDFHHKYQSMAGDINAELDTINAERFPPDLAYMLVTDVFDLHERVQETAATILGSLNLKLTQAQTELRIYGLIPLSWESRALYLLALRLMNMLAASLDAATLAGHTARFVEQWYRLKKLYFDINNLKLLKGMVNLPNLGESPPEWALRQKPPPQSVLPPVIEDKFKGFTIAEGTMSFGPSSDLQAELARLREEIRRLLKEIERLKREIAIANQQLAEGDEVLRDKENEAQAMGQTYAGLVAHMSEQKERLNDLEMSVGQLAAQEAEWKAKLDKTSAQYKTLRGEHLQLLKNKAAQKKALEATQKKTRDIQGQLEELSPQLELLKAQKSDLARMNKELLTETTTAAELKTKYAEEISARETSLKKELEDTQSSAAAAANQLRADIDALKSKLENEREIAERVRQTRRETVCTLLNETVKESVEMVEVCLAQLLDPDSPCNSDCTVEYCLMSVNGAESAAADLAAAMGSLRDALDNEDSTLNVSTLPLFSLAIGRLLANGKGVMRLAAGDKERDDIIMTCRIAAEKAIKSLNAFSMSGGDDVESKDRSVRLAMAEAQSAIANVNNIVDSLSKGDKGTDNVQLQSAVLQCFDDTHSTLASANQHLDELLASAIGQDDSFLQNVHKSIVEGSKALLDCIRLLVETADNVRNDVVEKKRGTKSAEEFYRANQTWAQDLISCTADAGQNAMNLVMAAQHTVSGNGNLDALVAAANGVLKSTGKMVSTTRRVAERGSSAQDRLEGANQGVKEATRALVSAATNASQLLFKTNANDFSAFADEAAKRAEMEKQIRALELERELNKARADLQQLQLVNRERDPATEDDSE